MQTLLKSFLIDVALVLVLFIAMHWMGLDMQWYHVAVIAAIGFIYGYKSWKEGTGYGMHVAGQSAHMSKDEFDAWLQSHNIDPQKYAEEFGKNESH